LRILWTALYSQPSKGGFPAYLATLRRNGPVLGKSLLGDLGVIKVNRSFDTSSAMELFPPGGKQKRGIYEESYIVDTGTKSPTI
jgi:hypothetical protein